MQLIQAFPDGTRLFIYSVGTRFAENNQYYIFIEFRYESHHMSLKRTVYASKQFDDAVAKSKISWHEYAQALYDLISFEVQEQLSDFICDIDKGNKRPPFTNY